MASNEALRAFISSMFPPVDLSSHPEDYIETRAAQLVAEIDAYNALPLHERSIAATSGQFRPSEWIGRATEILREVARDV